jgi:hypothetical protein
MQVAANKGVFGSEQEALSAAVARLVSALDPREIWLFGSRATGEARPDSDFDLLVVAKPDGRFGSDDYETVIAPLCGMGVGCDVIPCSSQDFEAASRLKTTLVAQVIANGRRIYEG